MKDSKSELEVRLEIDGIRLRVLRGRDDPDGYLWIEHEQRRATYFLGVLEPNMTRRDVKRLAGEE